MQQYMRGILYLFSYIVSFPVQICVQQAMDSVLSVAFCCIWVVSCKRFVMERI